MREFLLREVLHRRSLNEDRVLEVDSAFGRQGGWCVVVIDNGGRKACGSVGRLEHYKCVYELLHCFDLCG